MKAGTIAWNGVIILPNMKCISKYINKNKILLEQYFTLSLLSYETINKNPLVYATEVVDSLLSDGNTNPFVNKNQLTRLDPIHPFYALKYNKTLIDIITLDSATTNLLI